MLDRATAKQAGQVVTNFPVNLQKPWAVNQTKTYTWAAGQ